MGEATGASWREKELLLSPFTPPTSHLNFNSTPKSWYVTEGAGQVLRSSSRHEIQDTLRARSPQGPRHEPLSKARNGTVLREGEALPCPHSLSTFLTHLCSDATEAHRDPEFTSREEDAQSANSLSICFPEERIIHSIWLKAENSLLHSPFFFHCKTPLRQHGHFSRNQV